MAPPGAKPWRALTDRKSLETGCPDWHRITRLSGRSAACRRSWHRFRDGAQKGKLPGKTLLIATLSNTAQTRSKYRKACWFRASAPSSATIFCATGGTAAAAAALVRQVGAEVIHAAFIVELAFLDGRKKLDIPVTSLIRYDE